MKFISKAIAMSAFAALAACGGAGDDTMADNVEQAYDNQADALDAMADNAADDSMMEDSLENQADALREEGAAKEEAIDDADVNADAMTPAEQNAVVNGM